MEDEMKKLLIVFVCLLCLVGCNKKNDVDKEKVSSDSYVFVVDGVDLKVGTNYLDVKDKLPNDYVDKLVDSLDSETEKETLYTFNDYEIYTSKEESKEIIDRIVLSDENVTTKEGVKVGDNLQKVVAEYGDKYRTNSNAYTYVKGRVMLTFFVDNDEVVSIEYQIVND